MTSDRTIIIRLMKTAWAQRRGRPDFAAFCLEEARALLTKVTDAFEAMAEEEMTVYRAATKHLEFPRDNAAFSAAIEQENNARKRLQVQRQSIKKLWQALARYWIAASDYDKALEYCRQALAYLGQDSSCGSTYFWNMPLQLLHHLAGNRAQALMHSRMTAWERAHSCSLHKCCFLAETWVMLLGSDRSGAARRCLRKAESFARSVEDWTFCAHYWNDYARQMAPGGALRCYAKAESLARNIGDWLHCCDCALYVTKDAKSAAYCLERARQLPVEPFHLEYLTFLSKQLDNLTQGPRAWRLKRRYRRVRVLRARRSLGRRVP